MSPASAECSSSLRIPRHWARGTRPISGSTYRTGAGAAFDWKDDAGGTGTTAWAVGDGSNFAPSKAPFMINYRVADLKGLIKVLREEGCQVLDEVSESDFGIFGWVIDPEGNKVELWQPPASP